MIDIYDDVHRCIDYRLWGDKLMGRWRRGEGRKGCYCAFVQNFWGERDCGYENKKYIFAIHHLARINFCTVVYGGPQEFVDASNFLIARQAKSEPTFSISSFGCQEAALKSSVMEYAKHNSYGQPQLTSTINSHSCASRSEDPGTPGQVS